MKKKIEAQERTEPFIQESVLIVVQLAGFSKRLSTAISTVSLVLHPPPPNYAVSSSYKTRNCVNIRNFFDISDNNQQTSV